MPAPHIVDAALETARAALGRGDRLLQLQLPVGGLDGTESSWGSSDNTIFADAQLGPLLDQVERLGWRLEHMDFVFVQTGSSSSARLFATGEGTVTQGEMLGYYVFRRVQTA